MIRKGFTLVEMLAVVGIVAVLVILVLPNTLKTFREGKKTAFIDEAKTIYTKSTDTYVTERTKGNRIGYISNTDDVGVKLKLENEKNLKYNVMLDLKGNITSFVLVNNEFCIVGEGQFLNNYSVDDVIDLTDLNGKEMDPELVAKCTFDTFAAGTELYVLLHTDNRTTSHVPNAITLKYGEGWYKGQNTNTPIEEDDGSYKIDSIPTRTNYYYAGSKTSDNVDVLDCTGKILINNYGTGLFNASNKNDRKKDATAEMIKKYYTIVFNYNEGSGNLSNIKCEYGETCHMPETIPTRTGYKFLGWKLGSKTYQPGEAMDVITDENENSYPNLIFNNANICNNGDQVIENNRTFIAQWKGNEYVINYDCNNGNCPSTNPTMGIYDELVTINHPTRTGYTFSGWTVTNHNTNTARTGTVADVNSLNTSINGKQKNLYYKNLTDVAGKIVNYKANWDVITYSITYVLNGGKNPSGAKTSYTVEDEYTLPTPTRTGYTFAGWYTTSNFSGSAVTKINKGTTGNKTFYAKWNFGIYTITLDNKDATTNGTSKIYEKYTKGWYSNSAATSGITSITKPQRTDYTFAGYYDNGVVINKNGNILADNIKYTANKSLSPTWCHNCVSNSHGTCTLSINDNNGDCSYATSCDTGYTIGNSGKYNYTCTVITYSISYTLNGGTNPSDAWSSYTVENEYTLPTPTKTGYNFGGWYTTSNFSGSAVTKIAKGSTGNKTFYAKWNAKTIAVTFHANYSGSNATNTQSFTYDVSNQSFANTGFTRTNYTLSGWALSASAASSYSVNSNVSNNWINNNSPSINLYAVWTKNCVEETVCICYIHTNDRCVMGGASNGHSHYKTCEKNHCGNHGAVWCCYDYEATCTIECN